MGFRLDWFPQAAVELCAYVVCIRARGAGNEISIRQLEKKGGRTCPC